MRTYFLLIIITIIQPTNSFSWGNEGHRIMSRITEENLDKKTKDSLKVYLGELSLENCSVWMDEVRSNHSYDFMKPYHYINVEKGQNYSPSKGDNIINELNTVIDRLKHRNQYSKDEVATDIKILIHLVGDLHQPLHVGYGVDKGGNTITLSFLAKESNLHKVWDSEIIYNQKISFESCNKWYSEYSKLKTEKTDILNWMKESRTYLDQVYGFSGGVIDETYIKKNKTLIEKQLLVSGLRLSNLLEEIFI